MASEPWRPRLAITMGDAAGIGPEIVLKSLSDKDLTAAYRCLVIGDAAFLRHLAASHGLDISDREIVDLANLKDPVPIGVDDASTGRASAEYIAKAVELWRGGEIDGIATAPISKKAINLGGYDFPGHTEFLAELTDTREFAMSFFADKLRVVLLSTHLSLVEAIGLVKKKRLIELIQFFNAELGRLLQKDVRIAVAGLNPHASEQGMFGTEEAAEIRPAIDHCRGLGIDVSGPYSPDTIFLRCYRGEFDGCVALYHDQATIPVKSLSFGAGVNVTLGLPLIRTSVDHGTAYDIAARWTADASSMKAAIRLAGDLAAGSRNPPSFC